MGVSLCVWWQVNLSIITRRGTAPCANTQHSYRKSLTFIQIAHFAILICNVNCINVGVAKLCFFGATIRTTWGYSESGYGFQSGFGGWYRYTCGAPGLWLHWKVRESIRSGVIAQDTPVSWNMSWPCDMVHGVNWMCMCCRSNQEGHYPDLIKFTEERLQKLNPKRWGTFNSPTVNFDLWFF